MTSKEIIIKLIDSQSITGEEAYVLMNDVLKGEMVAVNETLKDFNKKSNTGSTPYYIGGLTVSDNSITSAVTTTTY